jgi:hypothetical protein
MNVQEQIKEHTSSSAKSWSSSPQYAQVKGLEFKKVK